MRVQVRRSMAMIGVVFLVAVSIAACGNDDVKAGSVPDRRASAEKLPTRLCFSTLFHAWTVRFLYESSYGTGPFPINRSNDMTCTQNFVNVAYVYDETGEMMFKVITSIHRFATRTEVWYLGQHLDVQELDAPGADYFIGTAHQDYTFRPRNSPYEVYGWRDPDDDRAWRVNLWIRERSD